MQTRKPQAKRRMLKNKKAASPAISTVIMTAATIVLVLVAMGYSNDFLGKRMAENEFSANKQFMLTTGLQIDDIAWTIGRTQTVRYTSNYGNMKFQSNALEYTVEINAGSGWANLTNIKTGMIMFSMPVNMYSMGNNYFERLSSRNDSFLQEGPSAPITSVYCIEQLPMADGNYVRIVAVPSIRMLNSTISGLNNVTNYYKFYLPILNSGQSLYLSQSVTLTGNSISKEIRNNVQQVRINVSFPNPGLEYDSNFFNFESKSETITLNSNSVVEFYTGNMVVAVGKV